MAQNDKIFSIINDIRKYYALGTPDIAHRYDGYSKIKRIVENKLEMLNTDSNLSLEKWGEILYYFKSTFEEFELIDFSYIQAPSLILNIKTLTLSNSYFHFDKSIVLCISLLAKYYTIYCMDRFIPSIESDSAPPSPTIYARPLRENSSLSKKENINKYLSKTLKEYIFIEHSTIFNAKISGTLPFGVNLEDYNYNTNSYPLGVFLFGSVEFFDNNTKIL